ncbi:putative aminoadipate reductase [Mycena latifolia]|nr:putative aminoadipate reductase [Mycena latifolia]
MHSSIAPQTIPNVVARNSASNPTEPFYIYSDPISSGIVTITHLEFGRAVDRAAHILRPNHNGSDGEVVAIIALSDTVLYQAILVALITANLIPFPISPRNSPAAIVHLLRTTSCHRVISTCVTLEPLVTGIKQAFTPVDPNFVLRIEEAPSLSQIYPNLGVETPICPFEPYTRPTNFPALNDVCLYLHSSGSTGLPKAIPQTHRALMEQSSFPAVTETRAHGFYPLGAMALPSFHTLGLHCQVLQPLNGNPVVVYPPTAISPSALPILPSPSNILEHARKTNCSSLMAIPALFSVWAASPDAVAYLRTLPMVFWAGGALPNQLGSFLHGSGVKLRGVYGATETGPICFVTALEGDEQEWEWYRFADQVKVRWVPQGDGTFECQLMTWENHTLMVDNLHDAKGYATADLFVNHPEKKYLWKIVGRIDDVIVHTSGEKTVPAPMEDIVLASPYVVGAVVFGRDRDQAGILIEPTPDVAIDAEDSNRFAKLRNKIWPVIEEANSIAPAFSRIFKEMILFTSPRKPLPRAAKGTVQRKPAIDLYSREIDAVYSVVAENATVTDSIKPPILWQAPLIKIWLLQLANDLCEAVEISPEGDLFQQGFDSLSATVFRIRITGALRSCADTNVHKVSKGVTQNLVYSHPTISKLATYLEELVQGTGKEADDPVTRIHEMIAKYTSGFAEPIASIPRAGNSAVVLLTGSTGNLGSQILASLFQNDKVTKVYALNRPSSASAGLAQRHSAMFKERGLDTVLLSSPKLVFVEGRLDQRDLGLSSDLYNELDFNLTLDSFEPHIMGTRHLVNLALSSPSSPKFLFTSSIAAMSSDPALGPVPKELAYVAAGALGYGQSKFVAEQILKKSGLHTTSLRIGQLFGGLPKGAWSTTDWIPILVKTSKTLGHLPLTDGVWFLIPVFGIIDT